jgi:hypothetical protein
MFCSNTAAGGQFHACRRGKGNWVYLAYRPSPEPFVSSAHQEQWSRSFCNAASLAYGVDTEWHTWWADKAKDMDVVEQYCVIPFADFRSSQATLRPRTSRTEFKSATETKFAKKLTSVGKRAATEPDLMSEEAQKLRSDTNNVAVFQQKVLCTVVDCGSRTTVKGSRQGPTMSFHVGLPLEGKACKGDVVFAIGYLGAPFTVEKVSCA